MKAMKKSVEELIKNPKGKFVGDRVDNFIDKVDTNFSNNSHTTTTALTSIQFC